MQTESDADSATVSGMQTESEADSETASGMQTDPSAEPEKIRILIIPKFEVGEMQGDFPGEAQYYYENYLKDSKAYDVPGLMEGHQLYVKDGIAMFLTGEGKVNASSSLMAVLKDSRFDFSDAYVISTGCMGTASETTVLGDVFVVTATADFDLGHHADIRDVSDTSENTWFPETQYDSFTHKTLDPELTDQIYELVKDTPLQTTDKSREYMLKSYDGAEWAGRDPMVMKGTVVTGDNYWKGSHDEATAIQITKAYNCPDPYVGTEMEDHSLSVVMDRMEMLEHFIIIRDSVNLDIYVNGVTPESLWLPNVEDMIDSQETADIFATAMENNYKVGSQVIDAILDGTIS